MAVESQRSDKPSHYPLDELIGFLFPPQNERTQVQKPIIGQARDDVLHKQATQAGIKKFKTVAKKAEKVKEKQIAMQRDNAKKGWG